MTPFGSPVLPLEKITVASSSNTAPGAHDSDRARPRNPSGGSGGVLRVSRARSDSCAPGQGLAGVAVPKGLASLRPRSVWSSQRAGNNHAESKAPTFSPISGFVVTSSRNTVSHGSLSFNFSRNAFEVTTVLISHCRTQEASASSEMVKFRLTGTNHAESKAPTFSPSPGFVVTSSRNTVSHGSLSFNFSRNAFEVTTVLISKN